MDWANAGEKAGQFVLCCALVAGGLVCFFQPAFIKLPVLELGEFQNTLPPYLGILFFVFAIFPFTFSRILKRISS